MSAGEHKHTDLNTCKHIKKAFPHGRGTECVQWTIKRGESGLNSSNLQAMRFAQKSFRVKLAELSKSVIWVIVPMQKTPKKASAAPLDWLRLTAPSERSE